MILFSKSHCVFQFLNLINHSITRLLQKRRILLKKKEFMKPVVVRLPRDFDKSFTLFREIGTFFPCPWHFHPEYELVLVLKSTGRRMVGDNIGYFQEGDLVCMGPFLPHVWVNDSIFINGQANFLAEAIVIHFTEDFLGEGFLKIPETDSFKNFLKSYPAAECRSLERHGIRLIL